MSKERKVIRIVPSPIKDSDSVHLAHGTKVLLPDGSELGQVRSVTLKASIDDPVWVAELEVYADLPTEFSAELKRIRTKNFDQRNKETTERGVVKSL